MSVEDKYEFLKVENERLQKENYELKTHMEGLEDGFHEVVAGLKAERDILRDALENKTKTTKAIIEMQLEIGNRVEIQFGNSSYVGIICNIDRRGISLTEHEIIFDPDKVMITKLVPEKKG